MGWSVPALDCEHHAGQRARVSKPVTWVRYGDVKGCERGVWVLLKVRLCNVRVSVRSLVEKPRWLVIS